MSLDDSMIPARDGPRPSSSADTCMESPGYSGNMTHPLQLRAGESGATGLVRVARALHGDMLARLGRGPATDDDIHEARLGCKRLRALWRLVRPLVPAQVYRRENRRLRDVARGLSGARDEAVMGVALSALAEAAPPGPSRQALRRVLQAWSSAGLDASREPTGDLRPAAQAFGATATVMEGALAPLDADGWALGSGLRRRYTSARRRYLVCRDAGGDEAFHDWRKQVKYLWYQLQFLQVVSLPARRLVSQIKPLQRLLGEDHDQVVLGDFLRRDPAHLGGADGVALVLALLRERSQTLRREALERGGALLARRPREFVSAVAPWLPAPLLTTATPHQGIRLHQTP